MIREYTIQGVFVALHSAVIIGGSMCTATMLKVMGRAEVGPGDNFTLWFVRNWGFLLILISLLWAFWTISLERSYRNEFSKRNTVMTGVILFGVLAGFLFLTTIQAGSSVIRSVR